jgi:hypothetical protein
MNHFKFMEIDHHVDFSFSSCFVGLIFPIHAIPYHFHLLCMYASTGVNEGLQVFIFLYACVSIMWDDANGQKCTRLTKF